MVGAGDGNDAGRRTKSLLLRAAAELIAEVGWGTVSTRMIAERAGVKPGLVHYHFTNHGELLQQAAMETIAGILDDFQRLLDQTTDVHAGVRALLDGLTADQEPEGIPYLLVSETTLAAARDQDFARRLAEVLARSRAAMQQWLMRSGYSEAAAAAGATLLAATVDGLALHRALDSTIALPSSAALVAALDAIDER